MLSTMVYLLAAFVVEIPKKMTAKVCGFPSSTATNSARQRDVMKLFSKSVHFLSCTFPQPVVSTGNKMDK